MRIGIDASELGGRSTGVGRYLGGLLGQWSRHTRARQHEFLLYAPADVTRQPPFVARTVDGGGGGSWWQQVNLRRIAARDDLDVFFAPGYSAPIAVNVPTVVAIHDVSFFAHPEWFGWREGIRRRWLTERSARIACSVITISEFSRSELIDRVGVPAGRIHVIPPGVDVRANPKAQIPNPKAQSPKPKAQRVLYVGSIFNRRHVGDLIRAFGDLARRRPDVRLDLVGDNRSYPYEDVSGIIQREGLGDRIEWHRYASEHELAALYAEASAFAFLSEYEGLGLTPLEALAAGIPPVLLDTPVARESCGDAALYVPAGDRGATADALEAVLFDSSARARLMRYAPAVLGRYSWTTAAQDTLAVLERCSSR